MGDQSEWALLVGGFAREPQHGDLDELASLPGPNRFLRELFCDLADVDVSRNQRETRRHRSDEDGLVEYEFICGNDEVGYRQAETVVLESSDFPVRVSITTFGLPGIELIWDFDLTYQGQLGHCGFVHRRLMARLDGAAAEKRLVSIWSRVFGTKPVFSHRRA